MTKTERLDAVDEEPTEYAELRNVLKKFVTVQEVIEALKVNPSTLELRIRQGAVLYTKSGYSVLIPRSEISRLKLNRLSSKPAPEERPEQRELGDILKKFATTDEAAKILNIRVDTLRQKVAQDQIPSTKAGSAVLLPLSVISNIKPQKPRQQTAHPEPLNTPESELLNEALKEFLTIEEAADVLHIKLETLRQKVSRHEIPSLKVGLSALIPRSKLPEIKLSSSKRRPPLPEPPEHEALRRVLKKFVTPVDASELLGVNTNTLLGKIRAGDVAASKAGSATLIPRSEITKLKRSAPSNGWRPGSRPEPLEHARLLDAVKPFITTAEASKMLGTDPATLFRKVTQRGIPAIKVGKVWLILRSAISSLDNDNLVSNEANQESLEYKHLKDVLKLFVTTTEAAKILNTTRESIYVRINQGGITPVKVGQGTLLAKSEVLRLLARKDKTLRHRELTHEQKELEEVLQQFATAKEVREILKIGRSTLGSRIEVGSILAINAGSATLVAKSEIARVQNKKRGNKDAKEQELPEYNRLKEALKPFVTVKEAADALHTSSYEIRKLMFTGKLPYVKAGYSSFIPVSEIKKLQSNVTGHAKMDDSTYIGKR
jgi:excisionase family DNA binding protein